MNVSNEFHDQQINFIHQMLFFTFKDLTQNIKGGQFPFLSHIEARSYKTSNSKYLKAPFSAILSVDKDTESGRKSDLMLTM